MGLSVFKKHERTHLDVLHLDEEALVRLLVESAPTAIVVINEQGRIGFVNVACEALFGFAPRELLGREVEVLIPARLGDSHRRHRNAFMCSPRDRSMGAGLTLSGRKRDGTEFPVEIALSPLKSPAGLLVAAYVREVSGRETAKDGRHEAEELFRVAFEEAPIGKALVALDGTFLRANRAFSAIVGYVSDELETRTLQSITYPDDLDKGRDLADKLSRGDISSYREVKRHIRKDGKVIHVAIHLSLVRNQRAAPLYLIAQLEEITERRGAEADLRRSETAFGELIEQANDAVFVADCHGRYVDVNGAARRMLGYSREELIGKTVADLVPPEDVARLTEDQRHLDAPGQVRVSEWRLKTKGGAFIPAEVRAKVYDDGRWVAFVRDISGRMRS
ncbi:MAG: PAS domain S-box protein [Polyangiaceae bacterium]|jgi:PAS domain S-box-containing protein